MWLLQRIFVSVERHGERERRNSFGLRVFPKVTSTETARIGTDGALIVFLRRAFLQTAYILF